MEPSREDEFLYRKQKTKFAEKMATKWNWTKKESEMLKVEMGTGNSEKKTVSLKLP